MKLAQRALATAAAVGMTATVAYAAVPESIHITCDVDRSAFRDASRDKTEVTFRLWTAVAGGAQLGSDYTVPLEELNIMQVKTQKSGEVRKRKFYRIEGVVGSDLAPIVLDAEGEAWLDVAIGIQTLSCDLAAPTPQPRKRITSGLFALRADEAEGTDGLSCWDLNGNSACDLGTEDINTDLACDALDCAGPQGEQGPQGVDGPQGVQGPDGPQGPEGPQGADGPTGPEGPEGPEGQQGSVGSQGPQGVAGADGAQGPAGADGTDGAQGPQGPTGAGLLLVRDGAGNDIGVLISSEPNTYTIRHAGTGKLFSLSQKTDAAGIVVIAPRLIPPAAPSVRFGEIDCGGQIYISVRPGQDSGLDPNYIYIHRFLASELPDRFYAPDSVAAEGTPTLSDFDSFGCDNSADPVPLPGANSYTATELTMPFPVPIVPPLQVVPAP